MLKTLAQSITGIVLTSNIAFATDNPRPERLISLTPHLTEAVFWLEAGDQLKGRDRYSNYPQQALAVPIVGDAYNLNIEALLAQSPDLVLLWQAPSTLISKLESLGLKTFNTNPQSLDEIVSELKRLANNIDSEVPDKFDVLAQQVRGLKEGYKASSENKALLLVQSQPPIALGMGDSLAASLNYCGWQNALQQPQAVINLSPEFLPTGDYQAVLSFTATAMSYLKPVPQFKPEADPLLRPGPRFPAALQRLCSQLNAAEAK
ncbi:MAG: helical backbone metal receptor [Gammaproteobacteria bacterium]|nr:helical backbone metal receptor [Gammaproteobacteria bacterium]